MSISLKQLVIGQHVWYTCCNSTITTNQKPTTDTQKPKEMNRNIPLKKIIKSQGKKIKENMWEQRKNTKQPENKEMTISTYIYTFIVNGLRAWKKDMEWLIGFKK